MKSAGTAIAADPAVEDRTRDRVVRSILENGPSTAAVLAERLGLTPAAVRRHLDALVADGVVVAGEERSTGPRGRGRPAKAFTLTDAGRSGFYQAYDDLAASALRFLAASAGDEAVRDFARTRVAELEARYRASLDGRSGEDRLGLLAEALTADGYAADLRQAPVAGAQLCQHHCPVAAVAAEFPQLCEAETEVFARLLGTHVQRLATIASGSVVCTTYVPPSTSSTSSSAAVPTAVPLAHPALVRPTEGPSA